MLRQLMTLNLVAFTQVRNVLVSKQYEGSLSPDGCCTSGSNQKGPTYDRGAFQPITSTGMLTRACRKLDEDCMGRSLIVNTTDSSLLSPQRASTAPKQIPTLTDRQCCNLGLYG